MEVVLTSKFKSSVKKLRRTYRDIFDDVGQFVSELENGVRPGDRRLQGVGGAPVYKAKLRNSSARSGKSGGFRVAYFVDGNTVVLLVICARKNCAEVRSARISQLLKELNLN